MMISQREKDLQDILTQLMPAARDILWCALVWNDHNFDESILRLKATNAATTLGFPPGTLGDQIERVNEWMARIDRVLTSDPY